MKESLPCGVVITTVTIGIAFTTAMRPGRFGRRTGRAKSPGGGTADDTFPSVARRPAQVEHTRVDHVLPQFTGLRPRRGNATGTAGQFRNHPGSRAGRRGRRLRRRRRGRRCGSGPRTARGLRPGLGNRMRLRFTHGRGLAVPGGGPIPRLLRRLLLTPGAVRAPVRLRHPGDLGGVTAPGVHRHTSRTAQTGQTTQQYRDAPFHVLPNAPRPHDRTADLPRITLREQPVRPQGGQVD